MPRIAPLEHGQASGEVRQAFDDGVTRFGRMTNMKRTLLHSLPSYHALMQWYPLFDEISAFLGERLAVVFAHAISVDGDCLICTTFMRRLLIDGGDDPDRLDLDEREQAVVELGRALAARGNRVSDALYARLAGWFSPEQLVALTGFGALMVATNIVNNVLEVELDSYLYDYRADARAAGARGQ